MRDYDSALPDLNKAIALRPDYVQALMNRGDIENYYAKNKNRAKAIEDYNKVIALGPQAIKDSGVCGHLSMAQNRGFLPFAFLDFLFLHKNPGC